MYPSFWLSAEGRFLMSIAWFECSDSMQGLISDVPECEPEDSRPSVSLFSCLIKFEFVLIFILEFKLNLNVNLNIIDTLGYFNILKNLILRSSITKNLNFAI
jgi:hypothetical protein